MLSSSAKVSGRLPRKWTVAEDQRLKEEVEAQMVEDEVKDWCQIAAKLPGRTNKHCRKRWHNSVAGGLTKGQWSKSEDVQLARGVEQYGQRWTLVANVVGSRSADQCAKRWQQSLDPDLDRSEWRDTDDEILIDAVHRLGRHWKDIQRHHFQGRSKNCIKNRYTVLVRRAQKGGRILPQPAGTPEPSTYSATDDDDMSYGSSAYDDLLPAHTQVSTPETQHSWSTDGSYSGWTSQESFDVMTTTASNYPHVVQPLTVNVSQGSQWDWTTTSINTHSPMMAWTSPHVYSSVSDHATLSPYDHYAATPSMLSPTTMNHGGHVARGPTSSPTSSTVSPSYQDTQAMAHYMRYEMRRDPPCQYFYWDADGFRQRSGCAS
ncbi:DNA-binding protein [Paraphaeosphaeria sporulosa]